MVIYNRSDVSTMQRAKGHWTHILTSAGIPSSFLNNKAQACPICREGTDRFTYDNKHGDGNYICRKCGAGTGMTLMAKWMGLDPKTDWKLALDRIDEILGGVRVERRSVPPNQQKIDKNNRERSALEKQRVNVERNWNASRPITDGDPVDLYLANRGIGVRASTALRYLPNSYHWVTQTRHSALVAVFRGPTQEKLTPILQLTYLTPDGRKAGVKPPRLTLPGKMPDGGAIRLQPAATVMGVAEGIESAMSAAQMFEMPVWATTSKSMLVKWRVPQIVNHLVIYADNDAHDQGIIAAESLARKALEEADRDGIARTVDIRMPDIAGQDWNDVLQQQGGNNAVTAA